MTLWSSLSHTTKKPPHTFHTWARHHFPICLFWVILIVTEMEICVKCFSKESDDSVFKRNSVLFTLNYPHFPSVMMVILDSSTVCLSDKTADTYCINRLDSFKSLSHTMLLVTTDQTPFGYFDGDSDRWCHEVWVHCFLKHLIIEGLLRGSGFSFAPLHLSSVERAVKICRNVFPTPRFPCPVSLSVLLKSSFIVIFSQLILQPPPITLVVIRCVWTHPSQQLTGSLLGFFLHVTPKHLVCVHVPAFMLGGG